MRQKERTQEIKTGKLDTERAARIVGEYKRKKLGMLLALEFKRDIHALIEKAYILRMFDESLDAELRRSGTLAAMERFMEMQADQRNREERRPIEESESRKA